MLGVAWNFGARADQAHFSAQNIPELRQFVQLCPSENPADASNALVSPACNGGPGPVSVRHHGPEFANDKRNPILTDSGLAIKNRATIGELYEQGYYQKKRPQQKQSKNCKETIINPLD